MSLDQLFKQNKQKQEAPECEDNGEFRSRAEEESLNAAASKPAKTSRRNASARKSAADDSALPEKKRARRRLIGAVALVLAAVIGLPMVFDSEPKSKPNKISIEIPSKDQPLAASAYVTAPATTASGIAGNSVGQYVDKGEEIVTASTLNAEKVAKPAPDSLANSASGAVKNIEKDAEKSAVKVAPNLAEKSTNLSQIVPVLAAAKLADKTIEKSGQKPGDKIAEKAVANSSVKTLAPAVPVVTTQVAANGVKTPDTKTEKSDTKKADDAARALALLEGRSLPADNKADAKAEVRNSKPAAGFQVQVAALNSPAKIRELQAKLKAANIKSSTQKITTKTGEVSRIRVGPFASKAEAEKMRSKLAKLGLGGTLVPN